MRELGALWRTLFEAVRRCAKIKNLLGVLRGVAGPEDDRSIWKKAGTKVQQPSEEAPLPLEGASRRRAIHDQRAICEELALANREVYQLGDCGAR